MDGFGSTDFETPFHYGSVKDGLSYSPSIEQRFKKQYWKTKQSVRQKLNKKEDQFVVAGDALVDAKLEKAHHLQTSCSELINAASQTSYHSERVSSYEHALGNYLVSCGELDFTLAGQIMKKAGNTHRLNAELRLKQLPAFQRLQAETTTFATSGLGDLAYSIDNLERARKEYRAALLWMKDVSEKLRNPDAKGQLVRFREAQAHVKVTKEGFEHLKVLLCEKIEMVSASRCNLLSNVLPTYQKATLEYLDQSAYELFKVLNDLRGQTQHQYKVKDLSQEIRDLEVDESTFEMGGAGVARTPELGEVNTGETTPTNVNPKDNTLFGVLQQELVQSGNDPATPTSHAHQEVTSNDKDHTHQLTDHPPPIFNSKDDNKMGRAEPHPQSNPPGDHLDGLLSLLDAPLDAFDPHGNSVGGAGDEWDSFMQQQDNGDDSGWGDMVSHAHKGDESSGWSQPLLDGGEDISSSELDSEINKLLSLGDEGEAPAPPTTDKDDEDKFDPLKGFGDVGVAKGSHDDLLLDPTMFQTPLLVPQTTPPLIPQNILTPSPIMSKPHPSPNSHTPSLQHTQAKDVSTNKPVGGASRASEDKKKNWMNVFAHLDPIANEKA